MYTVKRLKSWQKDLVLAHLLRLDEQSRYDRFCTPANDHSITHYVEKLDLVQNGVFGVFDENLQLIGLGECIFGADSQAEVAFSIEKSHQSKGLGNRLMKKLIQYATGSGITKLEMFCLRTNYRSIHMAQKYGLTIMHASGETNAVLKIPKNSVLSSQYGEFMDEVSANFEIIYKMRALFWKYLQQNT